MCVCARGLSVDVCVCAWVECGCVCARGLSMDVCVYVV